MHKNIIMYISNEITYQLGDFIFYHLTNTNKCLMIVTVQSINRLYSFVLLIMIFCYLLFTGNKCCWFCIDVREQLVLLLCRPLYQFSVVNYVTKQLVDRIKWKSCLFQLSIDLFTGYSYNNNRYIYLCSQFQNLCWNL